MKILIASNNNHKIKEINEILNTRKFPDIQLITPKQISDLIFDVEENGSTFEENARIKAMAYFEKFGYPTLSDDSGLEVEALNGDPGVFSARYSGISATDTSNRQKLINELKLLGLNFSKAQFRCNICFFDGTEILTSDGICKGKIILEERGDNGFGYDPLFIPDGYSQTFAQLSEEIKNTISHRGNALSKFLPIFAKYYHSQNY
jgi:XTP/dITP diphosphohydrolase